MKRDDPLLTPRETQKALGISTATYYRWLRGGTLQGVKVGGRWRFSRAHIDDLLSGGEVRAEASVAIEAALDAYEAVLLSAGLSRKEVEAMRQDAGTPLGQAEAVVQMVLEHAVRVNAEQVHLEPQSGGLQVREKIDGVLSPVTDPLPSPVTGQIIRALKKQAGLDSTVQDRPLDGSFFSRVADQKIEVRVITFPTGIGESMILRVLNPDAANLKLTGLGLPKGTATACLEMLERRKGVFIVNGPTGSGKTTTLYCLLAHLRSPETKIMTAESPVEIHLDGIQQGSVQEGMDFKEALRTMLRSDVDVAMVSEVREPEILDLIFTAAHTGHLLLTSLHCSDGVHALQKMLEHGVSPATIADNLLGILNQRLVRRNCPACSSKQSMRKEHIRVLEIEPGERTRKVSYPKGCKKCRGTGLKGRALVTELLTLTGPLREAILGGATGEKLRSALPSGHPGIREELLRLVFAGEISPREACTALPS